MTDSPASFQTKRGGRPRPAGARRDVLLHFRVTADEAADIEARASDVGMSLSDFLRQSARTVRLPRARKVAVFDPVSLHHLALLGSNLNQIARVLNTTGDTSRVETMDGLLSDIRAFLDRARDGVR